MLYQHTLVSVTDWCTACSLEGRTLQPNDGRRDPMGPESATPRGLARRLGFCLVATTMLAAGALADLSEQYAAFGAGPASFIMTPEELENWKTVKDDVEA